MKFSFHFLLSASTHVASKTSEYNESEKLFHFATTAAENKNPLDGVQDKITARRSRKVLKKVGKGKIDGIQSPNSKNDIKIFPTRCCRGNATLGVKLRHIYICKEGV
jgi:hypothetical protein